MSVEAELTAWAVGTLVALVIGAVLGVIAVMGVLTGILALAEKRERKQLHKEIQHEQV